MSENTIHLNMQTELQMLERDVPSQRTIEIIINPPSAIKNGPRPILNLALVLDRSGSMSGEKLDFAKQAATHLIDMLDREDRAAVVAYDDDVSIVAHSTLTTAEARLKIKNKIQKIVTGGSTNLSEGWLAGCGEVAAQHVEGQLERSLLLTDGLANAGIVDLEELAVHARELSRRGVSTSTFGIGEGFNEHLLEAMATAGGGQYYFIGSPQQIPEIFNQEFSELAAVTARDVEITLEVPLGVTAELLGAWKAEMADGGRMRIFIGALQSERPQSLYVTLLIPAGLDGAGITLKGRVLGRGDANAVLEDSVEMVYEYRDAETVKNAVLDQGVLNRCAKVRLADAVNESLKLERAGEGEKAYQDLTNLNLACAPYVSAEEHAKYDQIAKRMRRGMKELDRKSTQYSSYMTRKSKDKDQT